MSIIVTEHTQSSWWAVSTDRLIFVQFTCTEDTVCHLGIAFLVNKCVAFGQIHYPNVYA